ncbi:hypothetical protein Tamer19_41420 [Cupriavidus sp. TA19]|uniref:hypothetical protein n=1 Tax=Cupriavidus sp. TA19 TaxID=701108 RepID=UPI002729463C|nr:hypothetical protein [Cupriavidus sp. TA19]GLC94734.1 hypothetical protein Tamer19_41420 [Cupriavidus sp. TA19]
MARPTDNKLNDKLERELAETTVDGGISRPLLTDLVATIEGYQTWMRRLQAAARDAGVMFAEG